MEGDGQTVTTCTRSRSPIGALLATAAFALALACATPGAGVHAAPASPAPPVAWDADVVAATAAFEKATGAPLRPGFRIEATVFPRYYAVRSAAGKSGYFRDDLQWTANVRSLGWTIGEGKTPDPLVFAQRQRELVKSIPLELLIPVRRETRFVAVVWSAPDCPFCRRLEHFLEAEGISVYVAPIGLSTDGFARTARAWCAKDPSAAWRSLFVAVREALLSPPSGERTGCAYPRDALIDVGFFLGGGRPATPVVVFADGSSIVGWDDQRAPQRMREKLEHEVFFASP